MLWQHARHESQSFSEKKKPRLTDEYRSVMICENTTSMDIKSTFAVRHVHWCFQSCSACACAVVSYTSSGTCYPVNPSWIFQHPETERRRLHHHPKKREMKEERQREREHDYPLLTWLCCLATPVARDCGSDADDRRGYSSRESGGVTGGTETVLCFI